MLYGVDFVHDVVMDRGGRIQLSHNLCSLRGNVDLTSTPQDVPEDDDFGTSCRSVPARFGPKTHYAVYGSPCDYSAGWLAASVAAAEAAAKAPECPVCENVLTVFSESLTKEDKKDMVKIEEKLQTFCDKVRFCFETCAQCSLLATQTTNGMPHRKQMRTARTRSSAITLPARAA
eukprot:1196250-Prorocentrum_minimum.AAC.2